MRECRRTLALGSCVLFTSLVLFSGCADRGSLLGPEHLSRAQAWSAVARGSDEATGAPSATRRGVYRRIWPHEDGRSWTYQVASRTWDAEPPTFYPTPDQVPAFTLDDAAALLGNEPIGPNPVTTTGSYGLRFNGLITTLSGVTRQNLEVFDGTGAGRSTAATGRPEGGFIRLLRRARPDLALRIEGSAAQPERLSASSDVFSPTFLHGYAWEQNEDWIGTYGDLNQQVAWIFLTSNIAPGSEFTLQLVPDLADDVFLRARVLGQTEVATEAGTFHQALEVLYLVDFGVSVVTDVDGNELGHFRAHLYGSVSYVRGVGPIHSYERSFILGEQASQANGADLTLSLVSAEPGSRSTLAGP